MVFVRLLRSSKCVTPCVALLHQSTSSPITEAERSPLFRFGLIADIQFSDIDDASNFNGSETRRYRHALVAAETAVTYWNTLEKLAFVVQLGDLIDGQNAGKYGQGLSFAEPQSEAAFEKISRVLGRCKEVPMYHAIGNHELYNFSRLQLHDRLNDEARGWVGSRNGKFYYSFRPHPGWTFIMLNPYDVSIMRDKGTPGYEEAERLLKEYNPNDVIRGGVDFFADLHGRKRRYVPFNGGVGPTQLRWLRRSVVEARERGDRIVVLSHIPLDHRAARWTTVVYNYEAVLRVLHEDGGGHVVAVLAGHYHKGGYAVDGEGLHHLTLQSPLTHGEAHGCVEVYGDRLELRGCGALPSRTLSFPPLQPTPPTATPASRL